MQKCLSCEAFQALFCLRKLKGKYTYNRVIVQWLNGTAALWHNGSKQACSLVQLKRDNLPVGGLILSCLENYPPPFKRDGGQNHCIPIAPDSYRDGTFG